MFRVPEKTTQMRDDMGQRLTTENLLKAVGIANEAVESCLAGMDGSDLELGRPIPAPQTGRHTHIYVHLKPPSQVVAGNETGQNETDEPEIPPEKWEHLEVLWKAIGALEANLNGLRSRMEGLRTEMEVASKRALTMEEKTNAPNADVAQWNKAKNRVHYAVPKLREFIHRATWATSTPERKQLGELFDNHIRPDIPLAQVDKVREQLEKLQKDRQVLSAQGAMVCQECQAVSADIQGALRTLQSNAALNARKKMDAVRKKNKYF
jgi:hypothetical protein